MGASDATGHRWFFPQARMVTPRVAGVLIAALLLVAGSAAAATHAPYVPVRDDLVLETLPSTSDARVRQFTSLRQTVAALPLVQLPSPSG